MRDKNTGAVFASIINGYTEADFDGKPIFFKHFGPKHADMTEAVYNRSFRHACDMGVPTNDERMEVIVKDGAWSAEKDGRVAELQKEIEAFSSAKDKLFIKSQIQHQQNMIENRRRKLVDLEAQKIAALGKTAEVFAASHANEFFVYSSSFLNRDLTEQICTEEEFEDWPNSELGRLVDVYTKAFARLDQESIKRIAVTSQCINAYGLSGETSMGFYGKPSVELTYYQSEMLSRVRQYYTMITNSKTEIPNDVLSDPEKLENWFKAQSNASAQERSAPEAGGDSGTSMKSYVGAKQEDIEYAGLDQGRKQIGLASKIREKGGFRADDFIKMK